MAGPLTIKRWALSLAAYTVLLAVVLAVSPLVGSMHISVREGLRQILSGQWDGDAARILLDLRAPRVVLAFLAGGALALAGAGFQVILRNPLAEPFTLGVTGGSAVGAVVAIAIPGLAQPIGPFSAVQLFSLLGAAASLGLIYRLAHRPHGISMNTLLLAGVTISIFSGGIIMFITYWAKPFEVMYMQRWLMGGVDVVGFGSLGVLLPLLLPGLVILLMQSTALNHLSLGEELAAGHGVDVASVQRMTFLGGGLVTAAVVALTGPIGFVGLIIPHAVRRLSGFDQRIVLPGSFMLGGAFLAACDTAARTLFAPMEMPVGVITALVGGPLFIKILLGRRR